MYEINPSKISGTLSLPSSKSQTMRSILFASLCKGTSTIKNPLPSPDTSAMIKACKSLGARFSLAGTKLLIEGTAGRLSCHSKIIDAGNSGIILRFLTAVFALQRKPVILTGDASLQRRPMRPLLDALQKLGATSSFLKDLNSAPLKIEGPISPGTTHVLGQDSQFVSALLIAAPFVKGPVEFSVELPGEAPWIDLTLSWLKRLDIPYQNDPEYRHYRLEGNALPNAFEYTVPGDLSTAAFPIAVALITQSELLLSGIDMEDPQGDKALIPLLLSIGALIEINTKKKQLLIRKSPRLKSFSVDVNPFIDALPILAVLGCFTDGETHLYGAEVARTKECDRLHCIRQELEKMGADIKETQNGLIIRPSPLRGALLHSHGDHRLAMALTVAALGATGKSRIQGAECVNKTFPSFFEIMKKMGAQIKRLAVKKNLD